MLVLDQFADAWQSTMPSSVRMRSAVQFAASTNALDAIITPETVDSSPLAAGLAGLIAVGKDEVVVTPPLTLRAGLRPTYRSSIPLRELTP